MAVLSKVMSTGWGDGRHWSDALKELSEDLDALKAKVDRTSPMPSIVTVELEDAASGDVLHTFADETTVLDAWFIPTADTLNVNTNTLQLKNGATAVTDAINIRDKDPGEMVRVATIDPDENTFTGPLTITRVKTAGGDKNGGVLVLLCTQTPIVTMLISQTIADGAGTRTIDIEMDSTVTILDAWLIKKGAAGSAGASTIQLKDDGEDDITEALSIAGKGDKTITRFTTIDPAEATIEEGDDLNIVLTKAEGADNNAMELYILAQGPGSTELKTSWSNA